MIATQLLEAAGEIETEELGVGMPGLPHEVTRDSELFCRKCEIALGVAASPDLEVTPCVCDLWRIGLGPDGRRP